MKCLGRYSSQCMQCCNLSECARKWDEPHSEDYFEDEKGDFSRVSLQDWAVAFGCEIEDMFQSPADH